MVLMKGKIFPNQTNGIVTYVLGRFFIVRLLPFKLTKLDNFCFFQCSLFLICSVSFRLRYDEHREDKDQAYQANNADRVSPPK